MNALLRDERAKWFHENHTAGQLWQGLEEMKAQMEKQKSPKALFIKKEKDVRQELQTVQKHCAADTLSSAKVASQLQSDLKHKKNKLLQQDDEELKVAHVISQEKISSELQPVKQKKETLQKQLDEAERRSDELNTKRRSLQFVKRLKHFNKKPQRTSVSMMQGNNSWFFYNKVCQRRSRL